MYSLITGRFRATIFCKTTNNMAVNIVKPIPVPMPLIIPDQKFLKKNFFLLPKSSINSNILF